MDPEQRLLLRDQQPIPLSPKAFDLLLVLAQRSGQLVLKDDLMQILWPDTFVEESNLGQHVFQLRKALGDRSQGSSYIVTVPGRGYRFVQDVRFLPEKEKIVLESHLRTKVVVETGRRPSLGISAAVLALLIVAGALGYRTYRAEQHRESAKIELPKTVKPRRSVAVLGFRNLSGRPDVGWLSTAFSEMLGTELAAGGQVRLVSSEEVAHMSTSLPLASSGTLSKDTLARIHQNLGADLVVLGSYSDLGKLSGGAIRLDLALQDTTSGETLATMAENGTEAGVFQIVSQAGERLRQQLKLPSLSQEQDAGVQAALPANTEAERLYAEGLEKLREFDALAARDWLEKAIQADSSYALAHSALAEAWSQLGYDEKAKSEAKKSFELSGKLPRKDRLLIEGRYHALSKEWDKAVESYRTLFDFFPDDIEYGLRLAEAQREAGGRNDAAATIQSLRRLPAPVGDDPRIDLAEGFNDGAIGQYSKAYEAELRAIAKARASGLNLLLARALYFEACALNPLGKNDEAIAAAQEARQIYGAAGDQFGADAALEVVGSAQWSLGQIETSEKTFREALDVSRKIGNQGTAAFELSYLASAQAYRRNLKSARKLYEEALAIYRDTGDRNRQGYALREIAWVVSSEGDPWAALQIYDQSLSIFRDFTDEEGVAEVLSDEAQALTALGNLDKAQEVAQEALDLSRTAGNKKIIGGALYSLGIVANLRGNLEAAHKMLLEALSTDREAQVDEAPLDELEMAETAMEQSRWDEVTQQVNAALPYLAEHKDLADEMWAENLLARANLAQGNTAGAIQATQTARAELHQIPWSWESRLPFDITNARVLAATGKLAEAVASLKTVIAQSKEHRYVQYQLEARLALCEVEAKTDPVSARMHAKALEKDAASKGFGLIVRKARAI